MTIEALNLALDDLQQNSAAMQALRTTCPEDWRKRYVALRRKAQMAIQSIADAGEACFRTGICRHLETDYRNALNGMRARIAMHQAEWPVVVVDPNDPAYRESVSQAVAAVQAFEEVVSRMVSSGRAAA